MENVVLIIHLLLALALIGVVLMQRSEGGGRHSQEDERRGNRDHTAQADLEDQSALGLGFKDQDCPILALVRDRIAILIDV